MNNANEPSAMDVYALASIRWRVRGLVRSRIVHAGDFEDVCSDIYCEFLRRKARYNPTRSQHTTFTSCVVRNLVATVVKTCAHPGTYRLSQLYETPTNDGSGVHFGSVTAGRMHRDIAVRQVLALLPDRIRPLAANLCFETLTEISQRTGKSRSSLYEQRAEIRAEFERHGFGHANLVQQSGTSTAGSKIELRSNTLSQSKAHQR